MLLLEDELDELDELELDELDELDEFSTGPEQAVMARDNSATEQALKGMRLRVRKSCTDIGFSQWKRVSVLWFYLVKRPQHATKVSAIHRE